MNTTSNAGSETQCTHSFDEIESAGWADGLCAYCLRDKLIALEAKRRKDVRMCAELADARYNGIGSVIRFAYPDVFKE